jgi:ketosteroid isomerase-like protein
MKTKLFILMTLAIWVFTACEEKIDLAKEETAIKAVFEADKTAYLNQDAVAMAEFWVQDASSQKIFQSITGENVISGWENINASQQKEVEDTSWDRKQVTCTFSDFKIDIMDESAWIYNKTNWKSTFKGQPADMNQSRIAVMKKIDGNWKFALMAIYNFPMEEKAAADKNAGKQEQIELYKQFIGSWKGEITKDTAIYWDVKPYGTGMECYFKAVTKGKIVMEGKQLWGYDTSAGKFTMVEMMKGVDNAIYSTWFDTKNTCTMQYYGPVATTTSGDTWEWKIEFKNPDMFVETILKNNSPTQTITINRVK